MPCTNLNIQTACKIVINMTSHQFSVNWWNIHNIHYNEKTDIPSDICNIPKERSWHCQAQYILQLTINCHILTWLSQSIDMINKVVTIMSSHCRLYTWLWLCCHHFVNTMLQPWTIMSFLYGIILSMSPLRHNIIAPITL